MRSNGMEQAKDSRADVIRAKWRGALAILAAASAFQCGGSPADTDQPSSAGAPQGGAAGAASGASHGGSGGTSAGTGTAAGASGAAGKAGAAGSAGAAGGGAGAGGTSSGQACGDQTCGANQYCRAPCSGTGIGGSQSLGKPSCWALPPSCNGVPSCECICGSVGFFCTPGASEVQCGCA